MITKKPNKILIDLTGPQGNVFYLLGIAKRLSEKTGKDSNSILEEMRSDDYEHLLTVFEREFGNLVIIYR